MPPWVRPKAWLRCPAGVAPTKPALAASWYEERHHGGQRHARDHHEQDERAPDEVAEDHHGPARMPVGQPGQRDAADEGRNHADHEGDRREQRRPGPVEDQHGQRDTGELIPDDRQQLRQPQRPELGHRQHVTEPDLRGLLGRSPRATACLVMVPSGSAQCCGHR
jgi:hypothetical protein